MEIGRLRAGITLSADLAPHAAPPAPAVVVRTPYGKTGEPQSQPAVTFARAGYAVVSLTSAAGTEVIARAAAQDWCTGDVATWVACYGGRIQWLTALEQPPAPRAMVCLVTATNLIWHTPAALRGPSSRSGRYHGPGHRRRACFTASAGSNHYGMRCASLGRAFCGVRGAL